MTMTNSDKLQAYISDEMFYARSYYAAFAETLGELVLSPSECKNPLSYLQHQGKIFAAVTWITVGQKVLSMLLDDKMTVAQILDELQSDLLNESIKIETADIPASPMRKLGEDQLRLTLAEIIRTIKSYRE